MAGQISAKEKHSYRVGKYIIGKKLGEGGFGPVRSALNTATKERVAIKILDKGEIKDVQRVVQVRNEISLLTTLKHPNIVTGIEVLSSSTRLFLVMEYVDGGDMHSLVVKKRRLPFSDACRYFNNLLNALHYCHSHGISHRDLKLDNLLLTRDSPPQARVCDFGLANIRSFSSPSKNLCKTIVGTEDYSAPEVILGKQYDGKKADMWSAGVLLFTMVAGYCPFRGVDTQGLFESVVNCRYSFPKQFPRELQVVVASLLVINPNERPSAEALLQSEWTSLPFSFQENAPVKPLPVPTIEDERSALFDKVQGNNSISNIFRFPLEHTPSASSLRAEKSLASDKCRHFSLAGSVIALQSTSVFGPMNSFVPTAPFGGSQNNPLRTSLFPKFSELYLAMRGESDGISVMDRRYRLRVYRKCFIGSEAVTWIVRNRKCSRLEAVNLGQQLMNANIFYHVCEDHTFKDDYLFYRFREDYPGISKVLNRRLTWPKFDYGRRAIVVSVELLREIIDICRKHQANDLSAEIDFVSLQLDERYSAFRNATAELQAVKMSEISNEREKIAFLVNCHNMLWMHARVELGPATEAASETAYLIMIRKLQYNIGGVTLSLEDLRNLCSSAVHRNPSRSHGSHFGVHNNSKFASSYSHFWKHLLHPIDDGTGIMRVPQLWHPLIVFTLSDASRGSPKVVPLTAENMNVAGLRMIAIRHIEAQLRDSGSSNHSTIHAFLVGLAEHETDYFTSELLSWIDQIISEGPRDLLTWKVLQLKQLIKGAGMCQSSSIPYVSCSGFAPTL